MSMNTEQNAGETADDVLIRHYLSGDEQAFNTLYERYRRPLFAYLNRLVDNTATADDLFQQTWLKAIRNLKNYENRFLFFGWLTMIAHNLAMDFFRRQKTAAEISVESEDVGEIPNDSPDSWMEMDRASFEKALEKALTLLPEEQREVFALRKAGIPFKEIAEIKKCSINTALGRMNYALKNLRKTLSEWRDYDKL